MRSRSIFAIVAAAALAFVAGVTAEAGDGSIAHAIRSAFGGAVVVRSPADNDVLTWDAATRSWGPAAAAGAAFSGAQAVAGAATTVPTTTDTALALSTETYDTDSFHDNSTNNSRLTAPRDGYYFVTGEVAGADTSDYTIVGYIKRNGTVVGRAAQRIASGGGQLGVAVTTVVSMTSGQYVELFAWQNSGADRSVVAQRFTIVFMGPQ